jgi:hypothetical protein
MGRSRSEMTDSPTVGDFEGLTSEELEILEVLDIVEEPDCDN